MGDLEIDAVSVKRVEDKLPRHAPLWSYLGVIFPVEKTVRLSFATYVRDVLPAVFSYEEERRAEDKEGKRPSVSLEDSEVLEEIRRILSYPSGRNRGIPRDLIRLEALMKIAAIHAEADDQRVHPKSCDIRALMDRDTYILPRVWEGLPGYEIPIRFNNFSTRGRTVSSLNKLNRCELFDSYFFGNPWALICLGFCDNKEFSEEA